MSNTNSWCQQIQRCEAGIQDSEGESEGVQQEGRQVLREHVCQDEQVGACGAQCEASFLLFLGC